MPERLLQLIIDNFPLYGLLLVRVGAMVFLMPVFGSRLVPVRVKAASTLVTALCLLPVARGLPTPQLDSTLEVVLTVFFEFLLGVTFALVLRLIFAGIQLAGQMVGFQMGFGVASVIDPQTGVESLVLSQLAYLVSLLIFLAIDGHHMVLRALGESLKIMPLGNFRPDQNIVESLLREAQVMFVLSIKVIAPVMAVLFLVQVALGVISKIVPQMNVMIVSFPLTIAMGLFFFALSLEAMAPVLEKAFGGAWRLIPVILRSQ
ncbi:flagellar biosynthetic protein FliR [Thermosulfuriphilus sp.]